MKLLKMIIKIKILILILLMNISCIATTELLGEKLGEFQHEIIGKEYEVISDDGEWLSYVNLKFNVHYSEWGAWEDSDLTPFENMVIGHPPDADTSDLFIFSDDGTIVNWINNYWLVNINLYEISDINFELIGIEDIHDDYFLKFWIKSKQE